MAEFCAPPKFLGIAALCAGTMLLGGCVRAFESWNLMSYDAQIRHATAGIAAGKDAAQRSAAYADRADAYAEKSRYSRLMKLIGSEEYDKLFALALQDYDQALALNPENAQTYYRRGNAYYSRAGLDMIYDPTPSAFLAPARADFIRFVEKNPTNAMGLDMLGLTDASMRNWTAAIADFEKESALDAKWRFRLSDAYCNRGSVYMGHKEYALAVADLNQALAIRSDGDPCECEPYNPLLVTYLETREYDKARDVVARAQRAKKWIAPENLEKLNALSPH